MGKNMTVQEAGRLGGQKTARTHTREFFQENGRKGGEKMKQERGADYFKELGKKGAAARLRNRDKATH